MSKLAKLDAKAFERAVAAYRGGALAVAKTLLDRLAAQDAKHAGARFVLGLLAFHEGDNLRAEARFGEACSLAPNNAGFQSNWAEAARRLGKLAEAVERLELALFLDDSQLETHFNLGQALSAAGNPSRARDAFARAAALAPHDGRLVRRLAQAHHELGELDEAAQLLEARVGDAPDDARAYAALGTTWFHRGEHDAAERALRRSLQLAPSAEAHRVLLFQAMFNPAHDAAALLAEARAFGGSYGIETLRLPSSVREREQTPERRLRIGYVSTDFREHVTGNVALPLLRHHRSEQVEIYLYAGQSSSDAVTEEFRRHAHVWRDIRTMDDAGAAALIAEDRIDILVDLGMHLSGARWGIFARKPAPLQVCWFAYPGTTGISAIDYRVSDPFLDPPGAERHYTEETLRLPHAFWCWEPLLAGLDPGPLPRLTAGHVTFGGLNNFCKATDETLVAWGRVLCAVPDSRLLLLAPTGVARRRVQDRLQALGVTPERVSFAPYQSRRAYFELYRSIDVGLDTLPYNGHTTSLDAMWMGVPVLTVVGERCVSRAGLCLAQALDSPELVAWSVDELVARARVLVEDPARLAKLRAGLRDRLQASPLMDGPRFARHFEELYRTIWRKHVRGR